MRHFKTNYAASSCKNCTVKHSMSQTSVATVVYWFWSENIPNCNDRRFGFSSGYCLQLSWLTWPESSIASSCKYDRKPTDSLLNLCVSCMTASSRRLYCGLHAVCTSMTVQSGGPCTFGPPHCQKVSGSGPQDPHRIAATGNRHETRCQYSFETLTQFIYECNSKRNY